MKTSSDALFRLIKAMTKGEKSNFKKSTSQANPAKNASNYIKLFDAISSMSTYNEEALLKKFKQEAFVKNFVETKQYLKAQILKSLKNYSINKSIRFKLREELLMIEILMEKGIFDLAKTRIKKALKIAQKYELTYTVFELHKLQFEIAKTLLDFKYIETYVNEIVPEENVLLEREKHRQYYWHRYVTVIDLWKKHGPIQQKELNKNYNKYPLDSFDAANFYLTTKLNIGQIFNDIKAVHGFAKSHYELFQKHPEQINFTPLNYITSVTMYSNTCAQTNNIEEGLTIIREGILFLETIVKQHKISMHNYIDRTIKLHSNQLRLYLHHGSKSLFKMHYLSYKTLVLKHLKLRSFADGYIDLSTLLFSEVILEEWDMAEESYQLFNTYKKRGHRNDIEAIIRLLGVVIYYETNNQALLDASIDAAYQFIRTKEFLFKFIRQFINLFKYKMINAVSATEEIEQLTQFKAEVLDFFTKNPVEAKVLGYFDFIAWINSKVDKISIHEAYCKRLNRN